MTSKPFPLIKSHIRDQGRHTRLNAKPDICPQPTGLFDQITNVGASLKLETQDWLPRLVVSRSHAGENRKSPRSPRRRYASLSWQSPVPRALRDTHSQEGGGEGSNAGLEDSEPLGECPSVVPVCEPQNSFTPFLMPSFYPLPFPPSPPLSPSKKSSPKG